jgi:hypothetical protein
MLRFCDCCGSSTDCELCDDPTLSAEWNRLTHEEPNDPANPHHHFCDDCTEKGCNFHEPNGEGEHCGDESLIPDPYGNFGEDGELT